MKTISSQLLSHLAGEEITVAMLWKVVRTDGVTFGFTDHDQNITFTDNPSVGPIVYKPMTGATGSATDSNSDMTTGSQELTFFLESDEITETDIFANKFDFAVIEIRLVNWQDLSMGALLWKRSTLGEIKMQNGKAIAELRGLEYFLNVNIGETYGPVCRADLGDSRCKIDLSLWRQGGSVNTVSDLRTFVPNAGLVMRGSATPSTPAPAAWFTNGVITWLTGANTGYSMEIGSWDGTTILLFENMPFAISPGDTFQIDPGCNKLGANGDCFKKFNNIINNRSEEFIPGMDRILIYPNSDGSVPQ